MKTIKSVRDFKREDLGEFTHLHVHTGYSLLDGSGRIKDIIARAKELGMGSIAITDHGNMFGCVEFYKEALKQDIKPIIGCEVYIVPKSRHIKKNDMDNETHHLVLLVKDETGYKNLMKIVTTASVEGFYYKPRIDREFLKEHCEGLIAASACLGGEIPKQIMYGNLEKAKAIALEYKEVFKEDYYIEIQDHGMEEEKKVNVELIKIARELDIPLICTNDVHYIKEEDSMAHDTLLCIQTGKNIDDENRMRFPSDQFYIKSPDEMKSLFKETPEAIKNTVDIAMKCNFDYEFHVSKLPKYPLPEEFKTAGEYLKKLCYDGMNFKYDNVDDELVERLEYELGIINQMGYDDYFLIVWDFIKYADDNGIMTGPGRGSAAGSLVAYTLNITKIDPIKYNLIFERFLNPERVSMPDIDSDFCYVRRQEVIDYVVEKYGKNNVSQIITFGTMAARVCIRDVGRALNYSYGEVDRIAKMIPAVLNITIEKALEMNPELNELYKSDSRVKELIDISKTLEGLPRHSSTHAAGVVIASQELVNYVPLLKTEDSIVAQFDMTTLEELGLLKMDFLGLRNLTVIRDAISIVEDNYGTKINIDDIDYDDQNVYKMIGEGKTAGVFQLESPGMTSFMKDLKPDTLEDIIAGISLYRPGPMASIPKYLKYKRNPDLIEYDTGELESILDVTYGCMIYQEQVMQIVRDLAGYSMGRSDLVRRAMSKKKHKVMEEERQNFIYGKTEENGEVVEGCLKKGVTVEAANKIYDSMMDFASYAFNKSHAAAYAIVAYQTAYLMRYYPSEFIAAMLNSVMGTSEKVAFYIRFAEKSGIELLPPDINESEYNFTSKNNKIRFGLGGLKNAGYKAIEDIIVSRKQKGDFKDFMDFCNKVKFEHLNKRAVESLIKAGAFDSLNIRRSQLMAVFEKTIDGVQSDRKRNIEGQISLFDIVEEEDVQEVVNSVKLPEIQEFRKKHILMMEKEVTGLYISGHPLEEYENAINNSTSKRIVDIVTEHEIVDENTNEITVRYDVFENERVITGGIISEVSKKVTKRNELMAFLKIQDVYDEIEVIVFPKTLKEYEENLYEDNIVLIKGRINIRDEERPKIICEVVKPVQKTADENIYIQVFNKGEMKKGLKAIDGSLLEFKGDTPIKIYIKGEGTFLTDNKYWVDGSMDSLAKLREIFGGENVKVVSNHAS